MKIMKCTQETFFRIFPPETRNVYVNGEVVANIGKDIICDFCNADVINDEKALNFISNGNDFGEVLCDNCAKEHANGKEIKLVEICVVSHG